MMQDPNLVIVGDKLTYSAAHFCCLCPNAFRARYTMWSVLELVRDLDEYLQRDLRTRIPDIPVGWRMDGRDKLTCPDCRRRNGEDVDAA